MRSHSIPALILAAMATACAAGGQPQDDPRPEIASQSSGVAASGGVAASLSVSPSGSTYSATLVVSNGSLEPITNWQVVVNMGPRPSNQNLTLINPNWPQPSGAAATSWNTAMQQAFFNDFGSYTLFTPTTSSNNIAPGGQVTISWTGAWSGTTPTVVSVDGVPSGTALAGNSANGIDPIALAAATAALDIAQDYESGKLPNTGDSLYSLYDQTIWSAQSFRLAAGNATVEYDPNAPGYAYIPSSVKAALAFAQLDPTVASYLTAGLVSCFSATDGSMAYAFRADFLKGFTYPTTHSGSITNSDGSVDSFTVSGSAINSGQSAVSVTATSGPTKPDNWFNVLRYLSASSTFPTFSTTIWPKFQGSDNLIGTNPGAWHGHYAAACTPFNGPGGSTNPYFVMNNNGAKNLAAWFQGTGSGSCNNGCSASFVADPVPYAEPGAYYDTSGNLVGTAGNPFQLNPTVLYATPDHASQWATRVVSGVQQWGTFTTPVTLFGVTEYKYVQQM